MSTSFTHYDLQEARHSAVTNFLSQQQLNYDAVADLCLRLFDECDASVSEQSAMQFIPMNLVTGPIERLIPQLEIVESLHRRKALPSAEVFGGLAALLRSVRHV